MSIKQARLIEKIVVQNLQKIGKIICPYCKSEDLKKGDGWISCSHSRTIHECNICCKKIIYEKNGDYCWYTVNEVLFGISTCFESYIYRCNKCSGLVKRKITTLDDKPYTKFGLMYTPDGPQYKMYYECEKCKNSIQIE